MSKYIIKMIIFSLPLLLMLAFPFFVYVYGREFTPLRDVVELQKKYPSVLFLPAYDQKVKAFKILTTTSKDPTIITLGTSRVYTFQSSFFKPGSFYNAGGGESFAQDFPEFLKKLPDSSHLKVII